MIHNNRNNFALNNKSRANGGADIASKIDNKIETINLDNSAITKKSGMVEFFKAKTAKNSDEDRRTVGGWISLILFIVLLLILGTIILGLIMGFRPAIVLSGSMRPSIQPGDITVYKNVDFDTLKIGDVVMFTGRDAGNSESITSNVTHRIANFRYTLTLSETEKTAFEDAGVTVYTAGYVYLTDLQKVNKEDLLNGVTITKTEVITHGDANNKNVTREQYLANVENAWSCEKLTEGVILGKVQMVLPWIGIPLLFIKNNIFVIVSASVALFALWYLIALIRNKKKESD